jgi:hypothetical protein
VIELILAKLSGAGFEGDDLVNAYNVMVGSVVGFVSLELARLPDDSGWAAAMQDELAEVDAEIYPNLAANAARMRNRSFGLRWVRGTDAPLGEGFELLLESVIGGLRRRLPNASS